jgi:hypothetical protein
MLRPTLLAVFALVALLAPFAPAQGGYTTEKHPDIGITLPRARDYEEVPTQPDEEHVVLYFIERAPKDPKNARKVRPQLSVVWIDYVPDPPPPGANAQPDGPPPDAPPEEEGRTKAAPMPRAPVPPPKPPITTLERFLEQRTPWALGRAEPGKTRSGYPARIVQLAPREGARPQGVAWAYVFEHPQKRTIAFIGECAANDLDEQAKIWRYIAEHADFDEPEGSNLEKLAQRYRSSNLRGTEFRVKARSQLVRGWKAEDTENFIVVHHTPDQPLVRAICADIEAIRKEYLKLFPPAGPIDAVSVVRVCKDRGEYMAYGGMPGSAGYWNSQTEELVFYDATVKEKGKRATGEANTFIVLYHEALHQYIFYSAGAVPPHYWFNEGHGDYFSGANVRGGKVASIGLNPWRIGYVKQLVERNRIIPWKDIVAYERAQFYDPSRIGQCYAQAWSMVYFLRKSPVVQKHAIWSKILDTYFAALKEDYVRQLELLGKRGLADQPQEREGAGQRARKYALELAFAGVNFDELQSEWRTFVEKLEYKAK